MKIGVVSDTHRNRALLTEVVDQLTKKHRISALYHLGDDYEDVIELSDRVIEIIQVPGIYHQGYRNASLSPKIMESVLGVQILLVHSFEKDVTNQDMLRADIILCGHTHRHELTLKDGVLVMNPGHLKGPADKNVPASFGLLDIQDKMLTATILDLDFQPIESLEMLKSESGLYRTG